MRSSLLIKRMQELAMRFRPQTGRLGVKRILLAILVVAALPAGGLAIGQAVNTYREGVRLQEDALKASMARFTTRADAFLEIADASLGYAARDLTETGLGKHLECEAILRRLMNSAVQFAEARVRREDGGLECRNARRELSNAEAEAEGAEGRKLSRAIARGHGATADVLIVSQAVERGGERIAQIELLIELYAFLGHARESSLISDAQLALLADDPNDADGESDRPSWGPAEAPELRTTFAPDVWQGVARDGVTRNFAVQDLGGGRFFVLAAWPDPLTHSNLETTATFALVIPIITWALVLALTYFAIDRLVIDHIENLEQFSEALRGGDLSARPAALPLTPKEFMDLTDGLGDMASRLERHSASLEQTLREKEALLREVYHRVKNNLQLMVSLLNLQLRGASDPAERTALREARDRVQSLAIVHQVLYSKEAFEEARLDEVIQPLITTLVETGERQRKTKVELLLEPVELPLSKIVPVAMFAAEAVAAVRDGRSDDEELDIRVGLSTIGDGGLRIEIATAAENGRAPQIAPFRRRLLDAFAGQLRASFDAECDDRVFRVVMIVDDGGSGAAHEAAPAT